MNNWKGRSKTVMTHKQPVHVHLSDAIDKLFKFISKFSMVSGYKAEKQKSSCISPYQQQTNRK